MPKSSIDMPAATATAPASIPNPASLKAPVDGQVDVSALFVADKAAREAAVSHLTAVAAKEGPSALESAGFQAAVLKALADKKSPAAREGAAEAVLALAKNGAVKALEPTFISSGIYAALLETFADKMPAPKTVAVEAVRVFAASMNPWATALILPALLHEIKTAGKWQVKTGSLVVLNQLVVSAPVQMARLMPEIIPVLSEAIWDTKADVKKAARDSLTKATALVSNKDIERFIPALIKALINPVEEVPNTIALLSATTFVSEVDSATLSLMVPLLSRGLNEKLTATKRKVAVIVDNMSKLVDNAATVRPFIPKLLPGLIKVETTIGDPEARGVVGKAINTLRQVGEVPASSDGSDLPALKQAEPAQLTNILVASYKKLGGEVSTSHVAVTYASALAANMSNNKNFDVPEWETLAPYIGFAASTPDPVLVTREWVVRSASDDLEDEEVLEDEEEGEDLCNCQFSLAYGAKILLNTATLRLKRGHRYGLCGKNGTGKSTLMRAITNGQVEGFPSPDEVRTFYVEHDIDGSEADTSVLEFILSDTRVQADEAEIKETLASVGFSDERQKQAIGSLSGGWKMKLALARAMLFKADILLLDEPTNHLDVVNVAWLENYLTSLKTCTSIIVSHDSGFLNNTITDVLHLNRFKLRRYRGNLEHFVKQVPEAKSYYTLEAADDYQFKFPDPPLLEGVKTKEKSLLKMRQVGFQYPTQPVQQLYDITLQVSLSSRVAVLGPNGSGKSTLVKLLIGDMEANKGGEIWKHPNLVIGYVAQHAFHHIDHHLDKTPLEYMLWRYQTGEDMEEMTKANRQISEEEEKKMKEGGVVVVEGQKRLIDEIIARKKLKQSYEYEVSFKGLSSSENIWMPRDDLVKRGFEKKVLEVDTREAQRLGLLRPLVRREIEKHFADFGLEPEFVSHNTMRGLSGGQKVKIVLGAATWRRPHVICMDEPTNYLDRESLAALIGALKVFEGGVLIITHNRDFSESLCKEVWAMRDGRLEASGHNWVEGQGSGPRIDKGAGEEDDQYDAMGNKIENKKAKKLTSAEARKLKKERMARKKRGEEVTDDELIFPSYFTMAAEQPDQAFVLLTLSNASLTTPGSTEHGALVLECVTLSATAKQSLERDVFLVLRINQIEVPLDPGRVITVKSINSNGRSYVLQGSYADPTELHLTVSFSSHFLGGGIPLHEQEDLETFESILSQYADFHGVSEDSSISPISSQPSEKILYNRDGPNDSRIRGQLVLVNEDTNEVVGEVERKLKVNEDPALAEKGHEKDPVIIEIPERSEHTETAIEAFARTIPKEDQNWMTTGATLVSYGISASTNLLVNVISGATNYYVKHSKPGTSAPSTPGTPGASGSTASGSGSSPASGTNSPAPPVFLTSERTRKNLANVHAVSTQAAQVSSKTLKIIDGMIEKVVSGNKGKGKKTTMSPAAAYASGAGAGTSGITLGTVGATTSASANAPPPYSSNPNLAVNPDGKPGLPPRRSPSPQPPTITTASSSSSGLGPPLPPRKLDTKARVILSADMILSTIDESIHKLLESGEKNITAVVGHKYGAEAAQSSTYMTGTARNVALIYVDVRGMGRKALLKRAGKRYVKSVLSSHKSEGA
ncbi:hypothetical protein D9758_001486 [Tetrapyrgos nigripes]|uniref:Elongation factor 3 n=1 Tax=Tetrapyrgos nigripes TaxID=182062 RepID=A0A8H5GXY2_9AGAR|nr:hypothetical protein D9758_001486 [Tetrapyrgos nigripes]